MSNPLHPDIQQLGDGVWVPMSLAMRLFSCYFGNGPRLLPGVEGSTPPSPTVAPTPIAPVPSIPSSSHSESMMPLSADPRMPPAGWKPRGVAARSYPSTTTAPQTPPPKDPSDDARPS